MQFDGQANWAFVLEALQASKVGVWEWRVETDRLRVDPVCADLFGISPDEAKGHLPLSRAMENIHPGDYALFSRQLATVVESGGLFVAEYRTRLRSADIRWVLARGCFSRSAEGDVTIGRGIVVDVSESKLSMDDEDNLRPIHRATDAALLAFRELELMGGEGEGLRRAARTLLLELGRELAPPPEEYALPRSGRFRSDGH
jgi:hypothetical protein